MSDTTATNLFIRSSLRAGLYQQIAESAFSFTELGNRLITYAKRAQSFRRYDRVEQAARVLSNIPIEQYQLAGHYYLGLCEYRRNGDLEKARRMLEHVADYGTDFYRGRALASLAAVEASRQDHTSELRLLIESVKASPSLESLRGMAVVKGKEGFHHSAVKDLESLYPLAQYAEPVAYLQYLNSLAVELGEVGRTSEARSIIRHVLASPYAYVLASPNALAYPEWHQTGEDLKPASRSSIVPNPSPARMAKLLSMPPVEQAQPIKQDRPAIVISLEQWKKKMVKEENGKPAEDRPKTKSEQVMYIMNHITPELTEEELDLIIERIDEVHAKKYKN
jgi:tetratricopeptide (TPR) repeat protein